MDRAKESHPTSDYIQYRLNSQPPRISSLKWLKKNCILKIRIKDILEDFNEARNIKPLNSAVFFENINSHSTSLRR